MFNLLSGCNSVAQLATNQEKYYPHMHPTDYHYLTKLDDECQYAAARCAMGEKVCMYSKSALSGVESMNKANLAARQRTGIDIINAMILILK